MRVRKVTSENGGGGSGMKTAMAIFGVLLIAGLAVAVAVYMSSPEYWYVLLPVLIGAGAFIWVLMMWLDERRAKSRFQQQRESEPGS